MRGVTVRRGLCDDVVLAAAAKGSWDSLELITYHCVCC